MLSDQLLNHILFKKENYTMYQEYH